MKKHLILLLCAALLCTLCACGGQAPAAQDADELEAQSNSLPVSEDETGTPKVDSNGGGEETSAKTEEPAEAPGEGPTEGTSTPAEQQSTAQPKEQSAAQQQSTAQPKEQSAAQQQSTAQPKEQSAAQQQSTAQPKEQSAAQQQSTAQPKEQSAAQQQSASESAGESAASTGESATEVDRKAVAQSLVGRPVSELYAAIGRPISSDYAPSCLIDGEDGELIYDGFTVYTEKGANYETVYAVF